MRIVHHHDAAGLFGDLAERRQRAEVAVHAEHAVGDEQLALARGQVLEQSRRAASTSLCGKDLDRRAAQPAAVDDAGVVQLVGDDHVVLRQDGGNGAGVGREAALEDDHGLDLLELGKPPLQLHVDLHRAGDRPHGAGADAESLERLERRVAQPRMCRQTQIVVRRQVDDRPVVERRVSLLLVLEDPQAAVAGSAASANRVLPQGRRVDRCASGQYKEAPAARVCAKSRASVG